MEDGNNNPGVESESGHGGIFSFPAYRSAQWLENNRLISATCGCLVGVNVEPQSLLKYNHVRAYELKAKRVRDEMRNALFRQALFKIQNIEVLTLKSCKQDRVLLEIVRRKNPWRIRYGSQYRPLIAEELWKIDRCGSLQTYRVRYYREGVDGFYCKYPSVGIYPRGFGQFDNVISKKRNRTYLGALKMQNYFWDLLRGKGNEDSGDFTEAHMGEENNFYYNEELKRWVVRGEEDKVARAVAATPPPPKITESDSPPRVSRTGGTMTRGPLTSSKLYTSIPGIEIMEPKPINDTDVLVPFTSKSQFTPENTTANSKNDYDFVN